MHSYIILYELQSDEHWMTSPDDILLLKKKFMIFSQNRYQYTSTEVICDLLPLATQQEKWKKAGS